MRGDAEELRHVLNSCGGKLPERIKLLLATLSLLRKSSVILIFSVGGFLGTKTNLKKILLVNNQMSTTVQLQKKHKMIPTHAPISNSTADNAIGGHHAAAAVERAPTIVYFF